MSEAKEKTVGRKPFIAPFRSQASIDMTSAWAQHSEAQRRNKAIAPYVHYVHFAFWIPAAAFWIPADERKGTTRFAVTSTGARAR